MRTTKTRSELIREAADKLQIVGVGQELEADYADRLDRSLDPMVLQLGADSICNVVDTDNIPSEWFDALAGLLANLCAPMAGVAYDPQIKMVYEMQLRRLTSSLPSYAVMEAEYF